MAINFMKEAIEEVHQSHCDIYGTVDGSNQVQRTFNEAVNNQLRDIAKQEEHFEELAQTRQTTPVTDQVRDILLKEKERVQQVTYALTPANEQ